MNSYKIMIIDDEYSDRKEQYIAFLSKEYEGIDISFQLLPVEVSRELPNMLEKHSIEIDAFFIDARLTGKDKGWGTEFGETFKTVLIEIQKSYKEINIPPIFMVSKHWTELGFLSNVSKQFANFHYPLQPSRYYGQEEIETINKGAQTRDKNGKLQIHTLQEERRFIEKIILQARSEKYNSATPVDVLLQVAVPDEKQGVYQVLQLHDVDDQYLSEYGISYQETHYDGVHIVIVPQARMGMAEAARTATAAMLAFRPRLAAMVGICAGRKDKTTIGDLAIVSDAFDYSNGKLLLDGFEHRPFHRQIANGLELFVNNVLRNHEQSIFAEINEKFCGNTCHGEHIYLTPMGSGPWVVNNPSIFEDIGIHIGSDCFALDMEAYAMAMAADGLEIPWLIIKSIQDYADGKKSETEHISRAYAAFSSAYVFCNKLPQLLKYIKKQ